MKPIKNQTYLLPQKSMKYEERTDINKAGISKEEKEKQITIKQKTIKPSTIFSPAELAELRGKSCFSINFRLSTFNFQLSIFNFQLYN